VNAAVFLRPNELFPAIKAIPLYELLILSSATLSIRPMFQQFRLKELKRQPISLCVIGVLAAIAFSHGSHMNVSATLNSVQNFLKVLLYYALLVTVVNTPGRLHGFLKTVAISASLMVSLCVLDYCGIYNVEVLKRVSDRDGVTAAGDDIRVMRMRGTGIFQDPNDLAVLITVIGVLAVYFFKECRQSATRILWLMPVGVLLTGLLLTRSRGGLLAAGAAFVVLLLFKYGKKAAIVSALCGLAGLALIAGRQGKFDLKAGTGQDRILLWREGIESLKSPDLFFGIGEGFYSDIAGLVAHNSFVHAYVELGLFGGTFSFGCFAFAVLSLFLMSRPRFQFRSREQKQMLPYLSAMLTGWIVGMLSLSRCYVVPTYMVLGISAVYAHQVGLLLKYPRPLLVWNQRTAFRLASSSALFFAGIVVFVKLFAR